MSQDTTQQEDFEPVDFIDIISTDLRSLLPYELTGNDTQAITKNLLDTAESFSWATLPVNDGLTETVFDESLYIIYLERLLTQIIEEFYFLANVTVLGRNATTGTRLPQTIPELKHFFHYREMSMIICEYYTQTFSDPQSDVSPQSNKIYDETSLNNLYSIFKILPEHMQAKLEPMIQEASESIYKGNRL